MLIVRGCGNGTDTGCVVVAANVLHEANAGRPHPRADDRPLWLCQALAQVYRYRNDTTPHDKLQGWGLAAAEHLSRLDFNPLKTGERVEAAVRYSVKKLAVAALYALKLPNHATVLYEIAAAPDLRDVATAVSAAVTAVDALRLKGAYPAACATLNRIEKAVVAAADAHTVSFDVIQTLIIAAAEISYCCVSYLKLQDCLDGMIESMENVK